MFEIEWVTIVTNVNWTFVINLVQFFILVAVLNSIIYKPLAKFMDARATRLESQLAEAKQQRSQAEALRDQRAGELREANIESRRILEAARQEGMEMRRKLRSDADAQAQQILNAAKQEAEVELSPVRQELEGQLDALAEAAAGRVLGKG